jgi:hypothetical protein
MVLLAIDSVGGIILPAHYQSHSSVENVVCNTARKHPLTHLQRNPQRLSALYQYHNAPEVAPAHGLEYDDTIHSASSDKYPVVDAQHYASTHVGKIYDNDRPPRIIFGMKVRTFLIVAAVLVVVVVSAAVGGAVGGKNMGENHVQEGFLSTPTSATPMTTSTYLAATPTYTPLNPCPDANNTSYTSPLSSRLDDSNSTSKTGGLNFTRYCDVGSPLDNVTNASRLSEAFVYSLDDCIELCASLNFWASDRNCTVAVYDVNGTRPGNCFVGRVAGVQIGDLGEKDGTAIAILNV